VTADVSTGLAEFQQLRPRLFGIAYRMLGSATDAEDVLQDAWLRWQTVDRAGVRSPEAFLVRMVTNLCLTALDSARARREVYVGPWLPEPVLTAEGELGPLDEAVQRECVSVALLALLERLSPAERAAYVLREAFGYSAREVAELIGTTEANARQLHSRARRHVALDENRTVDPATWLDLVQRFSAAARDGDVAGLESMLADDVVSAADGGGVVSAARRPVEGREKVARYVVGVLAKFADGLESTLLEVNGETAIVSTRDGELASVWFVETDGVVVRGLRLVSNPEKLAYLGRQLSRTGGLSGL
jgi:RNA polymerase sigma-70 factor (TIGR02957 family)